MSVVALVIGLYVAGPAATGPLPGTCPAPRSSLEVSRRSVALSLLASRAWLDLKLPEARKGRGIVALRGWAKSLVTRADALKLDDVMLPSERDVLRSRVGTLAHPQLVVGSWALEAAGTLLWAVSALDPLPDYARPIPSSVLQGVMPTGAAEAVLAKARLRPAAALAAALGEAELLQWRVAAERRRRHGVAEPDDEQHLAAALRDNRARHHDGTDILTGRGTVRDLDAQQLVWLGRAAEARVAALRWACGGALQ